IVLVVPLIILNRKAEFCLPNSFEATIIYLVRISPNARCYSAGVDGHCSHRGATIPGDRPRNSSGHAGPAVLLLFCLAPHGVFPAARITPRAVSSYLAFSPLPVLFSKNRRYHFC